MSGQAAKFAGPAPLVELNYTAPASAQKGQHRQDAFGYPLTQFCIHVTLTILHLEISEIQAGEGAICCCRKNDLGLSSASAVSRTWERTAPGR